MFKALCCILLTGYGLTGQTAHPAAPPASQSILKLDSTLTALKNASAPPGSLSRQLAEIMMTLAVPDSQPARSEVVGFTDEFTRALAGTRFSNDQMAALRQCLVDVMHTAGTSNFALARRLQDILTAIRVDDRKASLVIRRFLAIREAVRGPDDTGIERLE